MLSPAGDVLEQRHPTLVDRNARELVFLGLKLGQCLIPSSLTAWMKFRRASVSTDGVGDAAVKRSPEEQVVP